MYDSISSWPFQQSRKILSRVEGKSSVTFCTGYGPSGLPHIGTFGEVVRTSFVRLAFSCLSQLPTQLICFSDDMDGLRKVPDNIPHPEKISPFLNFPLTKVPDPFGKSESFGQYNNEKLKSFLDSFGWDYTFMSATECYKKGLFDPLLEEILACHEEILAIILPTLRHERRKTYSPFLPISPKTGRILQVPMEEYREETVVFRDEDGSLQEVPVTGGHCKLQWKVDWGMRWKALGVDYEMAGKDLIDSVTLARKVCGLLQAKPPEVMIYEHFLDPEGRKISKSKGNGLSVEEWLRYGPMESLAYFMYMAPQRAKRLYFDVIPRHCDEYLRQRAAIHDQTEVQRMENPVWFVHEGNPPSFSSPFSFSLLLNLATACQTEDKAILWRFIQRLYPSLDPEQDIFLDKLVGHAVTYYHDHIAPFKREKNLEPLEKKALVSFYEQLKSSSFTHSDDIQHLAYEVGKNFFPEDLKVWFSCFYSALLGQESGPRVGSFIELYGVKETLDLMEKKLFMTPSLDA